jgi:hypothetical protein
MFFEYCLPRNVDLIPTTLAKRQIVCTAVLTDIITLITTQNYENIPPVLSNYCLIGECIFMSADTAPYTSSLIQRGSQSIVEAATNTTDCTSTVLLPLPVIGGKQCYVYLQTMITNSSGTHMELWVSVLTSTTIPTTLPTNRTFKYKLYSDQNVSYVSRANAIVLSLSEKHVFISCKNYTVFSSGSDVVNSSPATSYQGGCMIARYDILNHWANHPKVANKLNFVVVRFGFSLPSSTTPVGQLLEVYDAVNDTIINIDDNSTAGRCNWRGSINLNVSLPTFMPDQISDPYHNISDWLMPVRLSSVTTTEQITLESTGVYIAPGAVGYCDDYVMDKDRRQYLVLPVKTIVPPVLDVVDTNSSDYPKLLLPMY